MEWLRLHEYLAVWFALPLMVVVAIFQGYRGEGKTVGVARMCIYFGFIICLCAVFTPTLDDYSRFFAGVLCVPMLVVVIFHAWVELKSAYPESLAKN
jgi:uncharacterized membrane protein AbrB (regulator of aidB expression)